MVSFKDIRLVWKLTSITFGVVLLVASILAQIHYHHDKRTIVEQVTAENHLLGLALIDDIQTEMKSGLSLEKAAKGSKEFPRLFKQKKVVLLEIVDKKGRVISSNIKSSEGKFSSDRQEVIKFLSEKPKFQFEIYVVPHIGVRELKDRQKATEISYFDRRPRVQEMLAPLYNPKNQVIGAIHTYLDLTSFQASLERHINSLLIVSILFSLAAGILFYTIFYFYIVMPIYSLKDVAQTIAKGNSMKRANVDRKDEIGSLAQSFNEMTDALTHMEFRADTDGLTGLYNYRHLQRYLQREIEKAQKYQRQLSFAILDLDHFKEINDNLGHQIGDQVLIKVARYIQKSIRAVDYVARYGGEEFGLVFPDTGYQQAFNLCQRLRRQLPKEVKIPGHLKKEIKASIGVADFPNCASNRDGLIAAADAALLFAKKSGRDQVAYFASLPTEGIAPDDIEKLYNRLRSAHIRTIEALAAAVEVTEQTTPGSSLKIAAEVADFAAKLSMDKEAVEALHLAARLRDVGKISISKQILNKPSRLSRKEMEEIKRHTIVAKKILSSAKQLESAIPAVVYHHEHWDGSGYPEGLKGEEIPLEARVLAIVEAYQIMQISRPYRLAMSKEEAIEELRRQAGKQFDPNLVEKFVASLSLGVNSKRKWKSN
jgi:diguanylate cyclase (GGDEF)-like protein